LKAVLEANALGQWRTGAASAVATQALLTPEPSTHAPSIIGVIGSGWQAAGQIRFLHYCYPNALFRVFSRKRAECEVWCSRQQEGLGVNIEALESAEAVVREADVVITATTSTKPVFEAEWLKQGVHIN